MVGVVPIPWLDQDHRSLPREGANTIGTSGALVGFVKSKVTTSPMLNPSINGGGLDAVAFSSPGQQLDSPSPLLSVQSASHRYGKQENFRARKRDTHLGGRDF